MTVQRDGKRLGGNNVQVVLGAPDRRRQRLDEDVAVWLESGWWVSLRNQFAQAPEVAATILASAASAASAASTLSTLTAETTGARGRDAEAVARKLFSTTVEAAGPDYWR